MLHLILSLTIGFAAAPDKLKEKLCDKDVESRLAKKTTFVGDVGPLSDAAQYLSELARVPLDFDQKAFGHDIRGQLVRLGGGTDVAVATALQQLLDQVNATYEIRDAKVLVVPKPKPKKP